MFVDTKERPQGEQVDAVAPAKMKLSEAIRIGDKLIPERYDSYGECAMGAACYALTGKPLFEAVPDAGYPYRISYAAFLAEKTGTPTHIVEQVHYRHCEHQSRKTIADWLESQGL